MKTKLTETEKLKYWLDSEIAFMHIMLAVVLYQLVTSRWQHIVIIVYILWSIVYGLARLAYISTNDKNYLRVPKKWA